MRSDLIKRFDAIEALGEEPYVWTDDDEFAQGERSQWIDDVSAIRAVPPANIPQGEWIPCTKEGLALTELMRREGKKWYGYRCTNCRFIYKGNALTESRYCQWCGAKMKGYKNE